MSTENDKRVSAGSAATETNGTRNGDGIERQKAALPAYQAHPIGPLSGHEIERSSALIRKAWPGDTRFQFKVITLLEPAKAELIPYLDAERKGQKHRDIDRRAFVVYYLRNTVGASASSPPRATPAG